MDNQSRERAPNRRTSDHIIAGLCAMLVHPGRILRSAVILKPATILGFHRALVKRKYQFLFTPKTRGKPGPKGPSNERDLDRKLLDFKDFYNRHRTHEALDGVTPAIRAEWTENKIIDLNSYHWKSHCQGLYQTPMAA